MLYDLIGKHNVNGLVIWNAFISQSAAVEKTQAFVDRYAPLPVVSMDLRLSGCANLLSDDGLGRP